MMRRPPRSTLFPSATLSGPHIRVRWSGPPASPPSLGGVAGTCFTCPAVGSPEQFGWLPSFWDQAAPVLKQTRRTDARSDRLGFIAPPALADNGPGAKGMPLWTLSRSEADVKPLPG